MHKQEPRFAWTCSYQSRVDFHVVDHTGGYEITLQRELNPWYDELETCTEEGRRDVRATIGTIRRAYHATNPIPASTVAAFNAWRDREHKALVAKFTVDPDRYGPRERWESLFPPPKPVRGAQLVIGQGWIYTDPVAQAA